MIRLMALLTMLLFLAGARTLFAQDAAHSGHSSHSEAELTALRAAMERYQDHDNAVADGFRRFGKGGFDDPLVGEHWYHPERTRARLDLMNPSTLLYQEVDGELELVGITYAFYQAPDEPLPEGFTGDSDAWHVHDMMALVKASARTEGRPLLSWIIERRLSRLGGEQGETSLVMLHVWPYGENPDGSFAHYNPALPYRAAGLPIEDASAGGEAAARGISLLAKGACDREVGRTDKLARLEGDQEDAIEGACEAAADQVLAALDSGLSGEALNEAAAQAWRDLEAARFSLYTPEQQARIAALEAATRHGHDG